MSCENKPLVGRFWCIKCFLFIGGVNNIEAVNTYWLPFRFLASCWLHTGLIYQFSYSSLGSSSECQPKCSKCLTGDKAVNIFCEIFVWGQSKCSGKGNPCDSKVKILHGTSADKASKGNSENAIWYIFVTVILYLSILLHAAQQDSVLTDILSNIF